MDAKADGLVNDHELRLCFNSRNRRHLRSAALVHAVDIWEQIELIDLSTERSELLTAHQAIQPSRPNPARFCAANDSNLQLVTEAGELLTGYALFRKLTRSLMLLWPLALVTWIPGLGGVPGVRSLATDLSIK
jgi:hypothetical protein